MTAGWARWLERPAALEHWMNQGAVFYPEGLGREAGGTTGTRTAGHRCGGSSVAGSGVPGWKSSRNAPPPRCKSSLQGTAGSVLSSGDRAHSRSGAPCTSLRFVEQVACCYGTLPRLRVGTGAWQTDGKADRPGAERLCSAGCAWPGTLICAAARADFLNKLGAVLNLPN